MPEHIDDEELPTNGRPALLVSVVIAVVVLVVAGYGLYRLGQTQGAQTATPSSEEQASPALVESNISDDTVATSGDSVAITDEGVTWLAKPEKITTSLNLIGPSATTKPEESGLVTNIENLQEYYKVGTENGKDILLLFLSPDGPGYPGVFTLLKTGSNQYELITKNSESLDDWDVTLSKAVTKNATKEYASVTVQEKLTVNGITYEATGQRKFFPQELFDGTQPKTLGKKIVNTPYGPLFFSAPYGDVPADRPIDISTIYLKRPDQTLGSYKVSLPNFYTDDNVPQITWNDGTKNTEGYRYDGGGGCGSASGVAVPINDVSKEITKVGTTSSGEPIYSFSSADHPIVKAFYSEYSANGKVWDYSGSEPVERDAVSREDFFSKYHAVVLYKDVLNRYVILSSNTYGSQAECGKPVVYLYPTKTTKVSVIVDADIRISEPAYDEGWDVTAEPDGRLSMSDGSQYRSLFWEGQGHGQYPMVNQGFVVKQSELETTLRDHLQKLGLTQQESADFLDFWLPKMPNTPYVRLTWLGTRQMDELAPLTVTPKPDTSIRIFLDFAGLDQPVDIKPQHLGAPARHGFTLVEWGGLLRR